MISGPSGTYICDECIELCSELIEEELELDEQELGDEEMVAELARLLGSGELTEAVLGNAREMKQTAEKVKKSAKKK